MWVMDRRRRARRSNGDEQSSRDGARAPVLGAAARGDWARWASAAKRATGDAVAHAVAGASRPVSPRAEELLWCAAVVLANRLSPVC